MAVRPATEDGMQAGKRPQAIVSYKLDVKSKGGRYGPWNPFYRQVSFLSRMEIA